MRLALLLVPLLLVLAACGGDDPGSDAPDLREESRDAPTPTPQELEAISKVAVSGYNVIDSRTTLLGVSSQYVAQAKTAGGAELHVRVSVAPCDDFICASLAKDDYTSADAQANLKSILPSSHIDNPNLRWEFGEFEFAKGTTGLFIYALSYVETRGADATVSRASANSFRAWYHNGGSYITLEVFSRAPETPLSQADVEKRMTLAEAESAAREVFAAIEPELP